MPFYFLIVSQAMHQIAVPEDDMSPPVSVGGSSMIPTNGKDFPSMPPLWQSRYGILLANASDEAQSQSLATYGEWLEQELDMVGVLVEEHQTVLEYGAELGTHALWLSKMVGPRGVVYTVEPKRLVHIALCSTLALNDVRNVHPVHAVLGDTFCGSKEMEPGGRTQQTTLDSLSLKELHLLKINQRDALLPLLAGGDAVLTSQLPAIYFRLSASMAIKEIDALKALGYRCWSHLPYLHNADNFLRSKTNIFPGSVSQNVIAVHHAKAADFGHLPEL